MSISKERKTQLRRFQRKYNLKFKNLELLNQAFIHTSYTNENNLDVSLSYEKLEFYGEVNFMKAGILYSDIVNTVSKTYKNEIKINLKEK